MAQSHMSIGKTYEEYTVAVVCADDFEMHAVWYMLDEQHISLPNKRGDPNSYILGQLVGHDTVIALCPSSRPEFSVATAVRNIHRTFPSIQWHFLTGIGGGVPGTHDIRLGDVVVGVPNGGHSGLVQYSAETASGGHFLSKDFSPPAPMIDAIAKMIRNSNTSLINGFIKEMFETHSLVGEYQRPPDGSDVLFVADYPHIPDSSPGCQNCDVARVLTRSGRGHDGPEIHCGLIVSSPAAMSNTFNRDLAVEEINGDVLCFDVEATGLDPALPCIFVRGISDYADSHKNEVWQFYAAMVAAACTKAILYYVRPGLNSY